MALAGRKMTEQSEKLENRAIARPDESKGSPILTIRPHSGLSGDIFLAGFGVLLAKSRGLQPESPEADSLLDDILERILPLLSGCAHIRRTERFGIGGYMAMVDLPHEHEHRHLSDIEKIIAESAMAEHAKKLARFCFETLAIAEGRVHGVPAQEVHFHEVGALDSILDICAVCELYVMLGCPALVCGPLPMADGEISCAHGIVPAPAPVVLELLPGFEVVPYSGAGAGGELVTPTAMVLLRGFNAKCSAWPVMRVENCALAYGRKAFSGMANGSIFAIGRTLPFCMESARHTHVSETEQVST